jgi:hypothetical protein
VAFIECAGTWLDPARAMPSNQVETSSSGTMIFNGVCIRMRLWHVAREVDSVSPAIALTCLWAIAVADPGASVATDMVG